MAQSLHVTKLMGKNPSKVITILIGKRARVEEQSAFLSAASSREEGFRKNTWLGRRVAVHNAKRGSLLPVDNFDLDGNFFPLVASFHYSRACQCCVMRVWKGLSGDNGLESTSSRPTSNLCVINNSDLSVVPLIVLAFCRAIATEQGRRQCCCFKSV